MNSYILQAGQAGWAEMLQSGDKYDGNQNSGDGAEKAQQ